LEAGRLGGWEAGRLEVLELFGLPALYQISHGRGPVFSVFANSLRVTYSGFAAEAVSLFRFARVDESNRELLVPLSHVIAEAMERTAAPADLRVTNRTRVR
jgi:hypothetical protein